MGNMGMELDCTQKVRQGVLDRIIAKMPTKGHELQDVEYLTSLTFNLSLISCMAILNLSDSVDFVLTAKRLEPDEAQSKEFLQACTDVYNRCMFDLDHIQDIMQMLAERRAILKDAK